MLKARSYLTRQTNNLKFDVTEHWNSANWFKEEIWSSCFNPTTTRNKQTTTTTKKELLLFFLFYILEITDMTRCKNSHFQVLIIILLEKPKWKLSKTFLKTAVFCLVFLWLFVCFLLCFLCSFLKGEKAGLTDL